MAASSQSQNRCVFVGNIPYDATEEQLVQICEEVGPVVSFRLVIDRETGKPKGYGFCEYKDEETALSARRNLQGYEINGRQLRVDFAENGKNAERNRDQGTVGPGVVPNIDYQKNFGGPAVFGHPSLHQPMGDSVAVAAATIILGALGSGQTSSTSNQTGLGSDPLTHHLAKLSKSQLSQIISELKAMAIENKEQARQLLLSVPSLPRALFQAQVMLGMVSPQMLKTPNIRQASAQPSQPLLQSTQTLPGLPPLPQNKTQLSLLDSQSHHSQLNQSFQQAGLLSQSGVSAIPSIYPHPTVGQSFGPQINIPTSSSSNQQMPVPLSQNVGSVPHINSGYNDRLMSQNTGSHPSAVLHPQISAAGVQPSSSTSSVIPENINLKGRDISDPGKTRVASNGIDQTDRASKMVKLNDGRALPLPQPASIATPLPAHSTFGIPGKQASKAEEALKSEKPANPVQLPPDVDSTLLQQVLNLTPEQLSSLPPDQQQQVIQLQRMLRQAT